jgi:hypothetical protein
MLNYAAWNTPGDNSLQFTSKGILANNFSIAHNDESIALRTTQDQDSTVSVLFKNLKLKLQHAVWLDQGAHREGGRLCATHP